jgi:CIC family chloride channel protein
MRDDGDRAEAEDALSTLRQVATVLGVGALSGVIAALIANGFVAAIMWANDLLMISPRSRMMQTDGAWLTTATILVPAAGGLLVGVIHQAIPGGRPHAPPDVISAVQTRRGRLPQRTGWLSGLSALVSLGSGASVGQYGPLVHMGGTVGSGMARLFRADVTGDNIAIACGVAAAISTVFHAPIAGILFAHEVILRHFALRAFAPVAIASVLGYVTANAVWPQPRLFQIDDASIAHLWEFGWFLLLGIGSALVAVVYMKSILGVGRHAARLPLPAVLRPAVAGAGLGLVALWVPDILGIGSETLRLALIDDAFTNRELLLVLALKILATAWCLGMGFSGGVFSPALVIGSLFGALFGSLLGAVTGLGLSELVVYAVCGMVAVTAPVIGAPLTTIIIIFELTGSYELTIAALASVSLANLVASRFFGRSLFDRQLALRGDDLEGGRSRAILRTRPISELVSTDYLALAPGTGVDEALSAMARAGAAEAYLVDGEGRYRGTIHLQQIVAAGGEGVIDDWRDGSAVEMDGRTSLWDAMRKLRDFVGEAVPVLDRDGRLTGTVYESDLIEAYLEVLDQMREEEHASG